jgi:hypothetical protein
MGKDYHDTDRVLLVALPTCAESKEMEDASRLELYYRAASSAALVLLLVLKVTAQEPWLSKGERVKVDYDKPDAVKAIRNAAFDSVKLAIQPQDIPLGGTGSVTHEVFEIDFGRLVFDKDLPAELDKRGLAFADPLTAILYAARFPNRQRMHPINILFTDRQGQPCYLLLGGGPESLWDHACESGSLGSGRPLRRYTQRRFRKDLSFKRSLRS